MPRAVQSDEVRSGLKVPLDFEPDQVFITYSNYKVTGDIRKSTFSEMVRVKVRPRRAEKKSIGGSEEVV